MGVGNAYLLVLNSEQDDDRLEFQFMPNEIVVSRQVQLASIQVVGRSHSISQYLGGDDTLPLTLEFYALDNNQEVRDKCAWLQSLAYGSDVKLVFGSLFRNEVWAVAGVNVKFANFSIKNDFLPLTASVDIQLKLNPEKSILPQDVRFSDRFLVGGDNTNNDYSGYA